LSVQLTLPNCFVLKRVPHIWLFLTLLTLFSFQRTPSHCSATNPLSLQWMFSITRLLFYVNMLFSFFTSFAGNFIILSRFDTTVNLFRYLYLKLFLLRLQVTIIWYNSINFYVSYIPPRPTLYTYSFFRQPPLSNV